MYKRNKQMQNHENRRLYEIIQKHIRTYLFLQIYIENESKIIHIIRPVSPLNCHVGHAYDKFALKFSLELVC
jgi:hypothetical protein